LEAKLKDRIVVLDVSGIIKVNTLIYFLECRLCRYSEARFIKNIKKRRILL